MFDSQERSRKKRNLEGLFNTLDGSSRLSSKKQTTRTGILDGVKVCLSGMAVDEKERIHAMVEELGGQFTRNLELVENTHLIAKSPEGPKYSAALSIQEQNGARETPLYIVKPSWIEACFEKKQHVKEDDYVLVNVKSHQHGVARTDSEMNNQNDKENHSLEQQRRHSLSTTSATTSLQELLKIFHDSIFASCQFHLVGFAEEGDLYRDLTRLIRRGLGTIFWDPHSDITHVIINDDQVEKSACDMLLQRLDSPFVTSPSWIISCCYSGALINSSRYQPRYKLPTEKIQTSKPPGAAANTRTSTLFRGFVFVLVRVAPPEWAIDFDSKELDKLIRNNGGQILSLKVLEALKGDQSAATKQQKLSKQETFRKRTCYVIGWGDYSTAHMSMNPLLAQVKRLQLCDLKEVTPMWLKSCISEQKLVSSSRLSEIFKPRGSLHLLPHNKENSKNEETLRISITGYTGTRRTAMVHLIQAMGGIYEDHLKMNTSHLICRETSGPKYETAIKWKIPVVSIDWLYHIAKNGFTDPETRKSEETNDSQSHSLGMVDIRHEDIKSSE